MLSDALRLLGMQLPIHLGPRIGFKFCGIIFRTHRLAFRRLQKVSVAVKNGAILAGPAWRPGRFAFGLFLARVALVSQVLGANLPA
jgi:hypothetical protein